MDRLLTHEEEDILRPLIRHILDRRLIGQFNIDDMVPINLSTAETMILESLSFDLFLGGGESGAHVRAGAAQFTSPQVRLAEGSSRGYRSTREEWKPPLPRDLTRKHDRSRPQDD